MYENGPNASTEVDTAQAHATRCRNIPHATFPLDRGAGGGCRDGRARSRRLRRPAPAVPPRRRGSPTSATATSGPCSHGGRPGADHLGPVERYRSCLGTGHRAPRFHSEDVDRSPGLDRRHDRRLAPAPAEPGFDPTWSPDGSSIAFVRRAKGNTDIWTADVDGSNVRRLTNSPTADLEPAGAVQDRVHEQPRRTPVDPPWRRAAAANVG